ncbi:putative chloride channel-like protein CLC-g [Sesamum alatum]|uniref:Chloride channel-like protein CLC-g n=1 Tax=Sesamum alatum TaxID=300844 RepID=A0AAE1YL62_9LAMI|nr:putative chloride channel-like protein CLC-g [Sesamum alatum]
MLPALPNGVEQAADEESSEVLREPLLLLQDQRSRSNTTSQVAIVGSDLCPIESLDYEIIENDFFKQDWRTMGTVDIFQYIFIKWTLCFLIGLIVSLLGFLNNLAIENIAGVKFVITSNLMLSRKFLVAFIVFASSNLGLTFLSSLVTALIAPEAAGSVHACQLVRSSLPALSVLRFILNISDVPSSVSLQNRRAKLPSIARTPSIIFTC